MCNQNNPMQMLTAFALVFVGGMIATKVLGTYIDWSAQRIASSR